MSPTLLLQRFTQLKKDVNALGQVIHIILNDPATQAKTKVAGNKKLCLLSSSSSFELRNGSAIDIRASYLRQAVRVFFSPPLFVA